MTMRRVLTAASYLPGIGLAAYGFTQIGDGTDAGSLWWVLGLFFIAFALAVQDLREDPIRRQDGPQ